MRQLLVLGWIFVGGLAVAAETAERAGGETVKVASIEGVTEYRLANGARVLLFPEASRPTVTVNMTVLVGSRHEGYGESGMAHLLEHMVFKGTPTHPQVPKALRDHGASFNGTTNIDRTNYFETMPATDENLEFGIALESDRLVNSFVKGEDLLSEMTVVRNEFERGENSPGSVLSERIHAAAYEWHNYGKSTIGNRSDIERVPIENLQAFYKKYYQPDNVVLIVAGKFDEAKALALVEKYLGSIPKPTRKLDATYTEEPPQDGERTVTLRRVGAVGSVGRGVSHAGGLARRLGAADLCWAASSRSRPTAGSTRPWSNRSWPPARTPVRKTTHDPGLFFASASCPPETLDAVRDTLVKTLESLGDVPFTEDEVNKAKVRSKRNAEHAPIEQPGDVASPELGVEPRRLAAAVHPARSRRRRDSGRRQSRGQNVFPEAQSHGRHLHPDQGIDASGGAERSPIDLVVKDYKGGTVATAGEAFDPSPANLDARIKIIDEPGLKAGLLDQEEPRRNGLARADLALRQRRIAQGPDDGGRNAARPDDGRHEETQSPGPA